MGGPFFVRAGPNAASRGPGRISPTPAQPYPRPCVPIGRAMVARLKTLETPIQRGMTLKVKTNVKAGGVTINRCETFVQPGDTDFTGWQEGWIA